MIKKRDLSDDSKKQGDDDPKTAKESSTRSRLVDLGDVFSEGLDGSNYRNMLYNCLKN